MALLSRSTARSVSAAAPCFQVKASRRLVVVRANEGNTNTVQEAAPAVEAGPGPGRGRGRGPYSAGRGRGRGRTPQNGDNSNRYTSRSPEEQALQDEIFAKINATTTYKAVSLVLAQYQGRLSPTQIATLLKKAAQAPKYTSQEEKREFEELVSTLYGWANQMLPAMHSGALAMCMYAVGKLEYYNEEIVNALVSRLYTNLHHLRPHEAANTVWALGRINTHPGDQWFETFCKATPANLEFYNTLELSNMIAGMAKLGYRPSDEWLAAFGKSFVTQVREASTQEYVQIVYCLAALGAVLKPEEKLAIFHKQAARASTFRIPDITRTVWAVSQFDHEPSRSWIEPVLHSFSKQLAYCSPLDMATICYSLAYLKTQMSVELLHGIVQHMEQQYQKYSGDQLANLTLALAIFQYRFSERQLDDLLITLRSKLPEMTTDGLTKLRDGLPSLGNSLRLTTLVDQVQQKLNAQEQQAAA